ncbi:MAG: Resolvase protein [Paenibacillus sp.]|nr:Resolvase protein [Paenibacillus sp.]
MSHKVTKPSFKRKGLAAVPQEEWIEVPNTHEPLIDEETFALAQKVIRVKKRPTKEGEHQIFAGLLKCSTCGQGLSFARGGSSKTSGGKGGRGSFACNQSRTCGKAYCSFYYISYVDIYEIVLADILRHALTAKEKESAFAEKIATLNQNQQKKQWRTAMKERVRLNSRESELQTIQRKLYEDNALGIITDEQYVALSRDFTVEQAQLKERLKLLKEQLNQAESKGENTTRFLELVREYTDMKELTKPILNELIDKVVVFDDEKVGGKRVQRIDIYYRFVGLVS